MKLFKRKLSQKMKAALNALADGIDCGAKYHPQVIGALLKPILDTEMNDWTFGTCALGAAYECALRNNGETDENEIKRALNRCNDYNDILAHYGLQDRGSVQPITLENAILSEGKGSDSLCTVIYGLNDRLGWSRERIAQFLRDAE